MVTNPSIKLPFALLFKPKTIINSLFGSLLSLNPTPNPPLALTPPLFGLLLHLEQNLAKYISSSCYAKGLSCGITYDLP